MAMIPSAVQYLPLSGGTLTGAINTTGIVNTGTVTSTGQISTSGVAAIAAAGNLTSGVGSLDILTAGAGLKVKEGVNAKQGTATLVAGTVTVANTSVTASSRILVTSQADGGTPGFLRITALVAGTSFTITSSNVADTSTVAYEIFEPG